MAVGRCAMDDARALVAHGSWARSSRCAGLHYDFLALGWWGSVARSGVHRWSRRSGWSSGTWTSTMGTPSGSTIHDSTRPQRSRLGERST